MTLQWQNFLVLLALCALGLTSCMGKPKDTQVDAVVSTPADVQKLHDLQQERAITPAVAKDNDKYKVLNGVAVENLPEYRLGPGDILEIVYHIQYGKDPQMYKFEVQDKINVTFPYQPQFNSTVVVRSDGRITLPLIGEVMAESKTPDGLTRELNNRYSRFIIHPSVSLSLQAFNVKIDELKKAITTAPRGQSKIAPITPDGRISLPIIGTMQAAGLTVRQLEKMINERYTKYVRNLQTTLIVNEIHHMKFYVLGEVSQPGMFEMNDRPTVLEAIVRAGGYTKSACLSDVVVIRSDGLQKPMAFKVDLKKTLESGVLYAGLKVEPADIIYVPKTSLDDANDVIAKVFTKGLYGIFPFSSSFTVNYDLSRYNVYR